MAKNPAYVETAALCDKIIRDVGAGIFSPVYLLMGEEPYYPDKACEAIIDAALAPEERDFNQTIFYGLDTDAGSVASEARCYPMMAERRLVVLKEAQNMKSLEDLATYCEEPLDSTVLVILMRGAKADKRKALYKTVSKIGTVLESQPLRDYEINRWIIDFYSSRGLSIDPDAAALLGESAGTDLGKIALETDKMLKNLPEGTNRVTADDVEKNVGISRQFNIFELNKALSARDSSKALYIAARLGEEAKFALPMATAALFGHFYRILTLEVRMAKAPVSSQEKAAILGVPVFFVREYDQAVANYPLPRLMRVLAAIEEYDYKGKGGAGQDTEPRELLLELTSKILNV
ncbi:MAG: DNA polymerase III subunit delta [Bacteroidales bacterium]|nr:DNA polymerase III subunit delta [Bacteroidales bacterium]